MRLLFALALAGTLFAAGPTKDPLIATWFLDSAKSTFNPGPVPDQRTMTFEAVPNGFKHTIKITGAFGNIDEVVYTAKYDGKDYPMSPLTPLDTVSLKRIDANTVQRTGKADGKEAETTTLKVSADGKILTMTVKGSVRGNDYSSVQVYNRE
jgi:hypothetical protein